METVNVSGLKNNPSEALRMARKDVVVVMNRDRPDALIVGVETAGMLDAKGVKPALATALFRDGHLSLVRSARLAGMSAGQFASHVSRLGIAVVRLQEDETGRDMDTLDEWLASSSRRRSERVEFSHRTPPIGETLPSVPPPCSTRMISTYLGAPLA